MRSIPKASAHARRLVLLAGLVVMQSCVPSDESAGPTTSSARDVAPSAGSKQLTKAERRQRELKRCQQRSQRHPRFIPPVSREGGRTLLSATFADGSTAVLSYPNELELHQLGVQPAVSIAIRKGNNTVHERFLLITKKSIRPFIGSGNAIESYRGPLGRVRVFRARKPRELLHPLLIHFRVGAWNVIVGDGNAGTFMGRNNRRLWAENLGGYETSSGFIVLEPEPPLVFARGPGEPDLYFSECFRFIELRLERCRDLKNTDLAKGQRAVTVRGATVHRDERGSSINANWCTPSRQVSVYVSDHDRSYVDLVVRGLEVKKVSRRGAPS